MYTLSTDGFLLSAVQQLDGCRQELSAVALLLALRALRVQQSCAEGTALALYSVVQGVGGVFHDGCQFSLYPSACHHLKGWTDQDESGSPH